MATLVIMPRQGNTVESCIVAKWHKEKGETINKGEVLFTYETDKATFEYEAEVDGTILEVFFEEGDDVPVLTNMCIVGEPGEDISDLLGNTKEETEKELKEEKKEEVKEEKIVVEATINKASTQKEFFISPRAKKLAEETGADLRFATGSGPDGRVIEKDIKELIKQGKLLSKAASSDYLSSKSLNGTGLGGRVTTDDLNKSVVAEYIDEPVTNIRKIIAKSMHNSLSTMAQLTLNSTFDASAILSFRKKIKENKEKLNLPNITLNDIVLYAVAKTILNHKDMNAHFLGDKLRCFNDVNLGVAVDTPRGLMVPTINQANKKSIGNISNEMKALAEDCKKGTVSPDSLQGATFTITNLGSLGIESFTPVINPPQTGILGVNTTTWQTKKTANGFENYPAMGLSLTFDHRAVDGAPAARFLKDLSTNLENFELMMTVWTEVL